MPLPPSYRPGPLALAIALCLGSTPLLAAPAMPDNDARLDTVVVTATRTERELEEAPVRTEVVGREEIERTHARTLKEALENVPGLQLREIHGKSGYELSLQGLTSDQVLVLIDGLPISASTGSTVDLSQYSLAEVDRIEVVKGAASAQYGSAAMGGVINVITRRIRPGLRLRAGADAGSYGRQNADGKAGNPNVRHGQALLEGGNAEWQARLAADVLDDQGFAKDPDDWQRQGDAVRRSQYQARLAWQPASLRELWLEAARYTEDDGQRMAPEYFPPNTLLPRKTETITRDRIAAGASQGWDNGLRLQAKALAENYDSDSYKNNNLVSNRYDQRQTGIETRHVGTQLDLPAWGTQFWQAGFDWHHEALEQRVDGIPEIGQTGSASRQSQEVFLQNDVFLGERAELLFGLRYQDDSDFGGHAAPKVSLRYEALQGGDWQGTLRASVGQGYRVPNLKERHFVFDHSSLGYMVIGNPDLKPESSTSWQAGGRLRFRETLSLDLNAFLNQVDDLIQTDMDNAAVVNGISIYTYGNVARARTRGLESALRWEASDTLTLNAAYTLTDTRDLDSGSELTRRPRHMARLGLDWQALPATSLSLRGRYQSRELAVSGNQAYSPAWNSWDLSLNQKISPQLTGFVGANNLTHTQRDFSSATDFGPIAGRYVYLGISYAWDLSSQ